MRLWLGALAVVCVSGCTSSLQTLQPARTTPEGHVQVTTGPELQVPKREVRRAVEDVRDLDNPETGTPRVEEVETASEAVAAALVQPPSLSYRLGVSYGISKRLEVGIRTSVANLGGWARWQFLREPPGIYGALGFGVTGSFYAFPMDRFTDRVKVPSYSRQDFEVPLQFGYSGTVGHVWLGPKLVVSRFDAEFEVCMDQRGGSCRDERAGRLSGKAAYFGGQFGFALGYERFWIALELTVARLHGGANMVIGEGTSAEQRRHYGPTGLVLAPAVGIITWL